jgi:hypothetical protein
MLKTTKSSFVPLAMLAIMGMGMMTTSKRQGGTNTGRKCLLPSCNFITFHNGGFCSAAHCKEFHNLKTN